MSNLNFEKVPEIYKRPSLIARLWSWLINPHSSIWEVGDRNRAKLIITINLILSLSTLLGAVFIRLTEGSGINPGEQVLFILSAVAFLGYLFGRSRLYTVGAVIPISGLMVSAFGNFSGSGEISQSLYSNLLPAIVLAGLLLPFWGAVLTVGTSVMGVMLTHMAYPASGRMGIDLGVFIPFGILTLVSIWSRNVIERKRLVEVEDTNRELEYLRAGLEKRVSDRTRELYLAAEVVQKVSLVKDLNTLLKKAATLIQERFELYYVQVYLFDELSNNLILNVGTGKTGETLRNRGHHLPADMTSINGIAAIERRVVIVENTAKSKLYRPNPLLLETRSEMAIPLIVGEQLFGTLDIQSRQPGKLNAESQAVFETLAGHLSVAIHNAILFEDAKQARSESEAFGRRLTEEGWKEFLDGIENSERIGYLYDQGEVQPIEEPVNGMSEVETLEFPIEVAGSKAGKFLLVGKENWSEGDRETLTEVADQVALKLENLRLLSQAERYRADAELAAQRLTQQGWEEFFETIVSKGTGYTYDLNEVRTWEPESSDEMLPVCSSILMVKNQNIGELMVNGLDQLGEDVVEIVNEVAERLSAHLENLRLYSTAKQELVERRRAEENLMKFRLGLERTTDAIFITDPEGEILYVNPAFEQVYGFSQAEAIGKTPRILKSGLFPQESYSDFWKNLLNKQVVTGEIVNRTKDGRLIPIEGANNPIIDEDGELIGFLAVHRDISERKQAREALTKRAVELETVAQLSTAISAISDPAEIMQNAVDMVKAAFSLYHAHIYEMQEERQVLILAAGAGEVGAQMVAEGWEIPVEHERSVVARAARKRQGVIVNDITSDPDFLHNALLPDTRAEMAIPVLAGDKLLGVLDVQSEQVGRFTQEDINIQTTLASQVAVALENAKLFQQIQHQAEYEAMINSISQKIQSTNTVESAMQVAIRELGRALGAQRTSIHLNVKQEQKADMPGTNGGERRNGK